MHPVFRLAKILSHKNTPKIRDPKWGICGWEGQDREQRGDLFDPSKGDLYHAKPERKFMKSRD